MVRAFILPCAVVCAFIVGIAGAYAAYRPALARADSMQQITKSIPQTEPMSTVRLRGTVRAIEQNGSLITLDVQDLYDRTRTNTLKVQVVSASSTPGFTVGDDVFFTIFRGVGPLRARDFRKPLI